jgi:hypothetical protein
MVFLILAIIGALIAGCALLVAVANHYEAQAVIGIICFGIVSIAQGFIISVLFRALAEIIRLLRQIAKQG